MKEQTNLYVKPGYKETIRRLEATVNDLKSAGGPPSRALAEKTLSELTTLLAELKTHFLDSSHSFFPEEHRWMIGSGISNRGFIMAAYHSAASNPEIVPSYLSIEKFKEKVADIDFKQGFSSQMKSLADSVYHGLRVDSDTAYHYALEYYNYLKGIAGIRSSGAETEYLHLKSFFKRTKRKNKNGESTPNNSKGMR
jgi:hypothetical protein